MKNSINRRTKKKWMGLQLLPLSALVFSLIMTACSSIDCPVKNTVYTVYNLLKADGTQDTLKYDTLTITSLRADGTDTTLLNKFCGSSALTFDLPVSYSHPEDTLFFELNDTLGNSYNDTVFVKKDSYPHFESVDCQAAFFHQLTAVRSTHHAIDSIVINHSSVTYDASTPHFYLYIKSEANR